MPHAPYKLFKEIRLPGTPEEIFPFFSDAGNLQVITPPWMNFRVVTPTPIEMKVGTLIDYRLKVHGIPIRWRSEITEWDPPYSFVDQQLKGPYKLWHHRHTFKADGNETICGDDVDYAVPGGACTHALFVKRDLEKIFNFRQQKLAELFPRK